ncbi:PRP3-domain-containing protein [Trematosphaeria pertusa]|uniref:PRP3-domain-containing protein n=1 Tax=Trematosphaeria pertusa TaxID=390896 RepID=A0A6A6I433_9PLEO|nr:PRP3-domain-containing protein [Trematosphaeria pertusa]KAF2244959.1 PRP3-domain-containing protein [Trematosphaeria pertusa]
MMVEKRPHPGDHGDAGRDKRSRPSEPPTRPAAQRPRHTDAIETARAKAAAIAAKMATKRVEGSNEATPTPPPQAPGLAAPAASSTLDAMKARIAALSAGKDIGKPRVETDASRTPPTLGNRRLEPTKVETKSKTPAPAPKADDERDNPYFDPKSAGVARGRVSRGLLFNQRGKYLEQGSKLRNQNRLEQIKKMLAQQARRAGLDENSERGFLVQPPPDIEWWDEGILEEKTYDCLDDPAKIKIDGDDSIITIYVQHPPFLKAPQDQRLIETKPMYLTPKEQAKLRRMRRAEELKEHQAKIRLGLEPPPPPKVKRGNMMRVMGEQAIADPTAVEMLVESQIAERHDKHVQTNDERKLTKEQRIAKLTDNQVKDAAKGLYMCVFKVDTLAFGKHRYQIDQNAKQLALTGITLFNPNMNLVIIEGGIHAIHKYKKLMLQRIKWDENARPTEIQQEKQATDPQWMKSVDAQGNLKDLSYNKCTLVFEGEVKQRAFRKWGSKMCETDGEAKELLSRSKLDSLWALAKSSD